MKIITYSREIQGIAQEVIFEDMPLDEQFQVAIKFSLKSLITCMLIEEEARRQDQKNEMLNQEHQPQQELEPQKVQYAKSSTKNDSDNAFICFKCGKSDHMALKYNNKPMGGPP
ncbi:hypothetical protein Lal_00001175 [Lupinus albus]|nr:hypothetical protein Lal_00001175 [Lupinus albus]